MTEFKTYLQQLVEDKKLPRSRAIEIWEFFNEECEETSESHAWDLAQQEINFALKEPDPYDHIEERERDALLGQDERLSAEEND